MWKNLLAEKIRKAREAKNLTQSDVSVKLGVSIQSISSWENGKALPSFKNLEQLASLTDNEMVFFFLHERVNNEQRLDDVTDEAKLMSYFSLLNHVGRNHAMAILKCLSLDSDMLK